MDGVDSNTGSSLLSQHTDYSDIELKLARAEKLLNILGYIPLICSPSGVARGLYGLISIVSGCVSTCFAVITEYAVYSAKERSLSRPIRHLSYVRHGVENVCRGVIECLPFVFNNLVLIAYDITIRRHEYEAEKWERLGLKV